MRWRTAAAFDSDECLHTLSWDLPDPEEDGALMAVSVHVALAEGRACVIVRQSLVVRGARISRLRLSLDPPPIAAELAQLLPATEDGLPLRLEPRKVADGRDVRELAALLFNPDRVLPVVVISLANSTDIGPAPLVDPVAIARTLVGVAHVVVLDSVIVSFYLTKSLGRSLSVFNGAARLYWPGAVAMGDPRHNTLFIPQDRTEWATASIRRALVRRVMPVAVVRFSTADLESRLRRSAAQDRDLELRRLRASVKAAGPGADVRDQLRALWDENERLRRLNDDLCDELAAAQEDLRTTAARWIAGTQEEGESTDYLPPGVVGRAGP